MSLLLPPNVAASVNQIHQRAKTTKATEQFRAGSTNPLEGDPAPEDVFGILNDPSVEVTLSDIQEAAGQGNQIGQLVTEIIEQRAVELAKERGEEFSDGHKTEVWEAWTEADTEAAQASIQTRHEHALAKSTGNRPFGVVADTPNEPSA